MFPCYTIMIVTFDPIFHYATNSSPGRHSIDVQIGGSQVDGSPFYVDVFDLSTIRVDNFKHGEVGAHAGFSGK